MACIPVQHDPDGDKIYYFFDWGDGSYSGWVGPYNSGQTAQAQYKWSEQGSFEVRVRAKDDHGKQSEWSDPLPITLPKNNPYEFNWLDYLLNRIFDRYPLLEQILLSRPIIGSLLQQ